MTEVNTGRVSLEGGEICSKENCTRPAVEGIRTVYNDINYICARHREIGLEQGGLDWIHGEISQVENWLSQLKNTPESVWAGAGSWKHFLILKDEVSEDLNMSYKWQHECTLESLVAALDVARKLTQEKIDLMEKSLAEEDEYPGDVDDIGD